MIDRQELIRTLRATFWDSLDEYGSDFLWFDPDGERVDGDIPRESWGYMADEVLNLGRPISSRQVERLREDILSAMWSGEYVTHGEPDLEDFADRVMESVFSFFGLVTEL